MSERRVEVLVFDGCPNVDVTLERARIAIHDAKVTADLQLVHVDSDKQARHLRFLGSPTVRVDGADIDPTAESRDDFGLQCRMYSVGGRLEGAPPADWIASALRGERPDHASASPVPGGCCARRGGQS